VCANRDPVYYGGVGRNAIHYKWIGPVDWKCVPAACDPVIFVRVQPEKE